MFVPFLYPENPAPDAWLRRTYVFFISFFVLFRFLFPLFPSYFYALSFMYKNSFAIVRKTV